MTTFKTALAAAAAATFASAAWAQCSGTMSADPEPFGSPCSDRYAHWDREAHPVAVVPVPSAKMTAMQGEQEVTTLRVPSSKMHGDQRAAEALATTGRKAVTTASAP